MYNMTPSPTVLSLYDSPLLVSFVFAYWLLSKILGYYETEEILDVGQCVMFLKIRV